jgi:hypothetical protein
VAVEFTQPLREMSAMNLPVEQNVANADNLTAICELIVWKM